jgi:histidine phosphotransferase ChpT
VTDDLKLIELVAARLCHDLVGPVGAIVNGVELLGDGGAPDPEITTLIADSAKRASRRLQVYRVAYGSASNLSSMRRLDESRRLLQSLCESQPNLTLDWPSADDAAEQASGRVTVKITLILGLIASEILPRGGRIRVRHLARPENRIAVRVSAEGTQARLPDELVVAFGATDVDSSSPKAVPVILAKRLAQAVGGTLTIATNAAEHIEIRGDLPAGA